jgi:hypothetical protein
MIPKEVSTGFFALRISIVFESGLTFRGQALWFLNECNHLTVGAISVHPLYITIKPQTDRRQAPCHAFQPTSTSFCAAEEAGAPLRNYNTHYLRRHISNLPRRPVFTREKTTFYLSPPLVSCSLDSTFSLWYTTRDLLLLILTSSPLAFFLSCPDVGLHYVTGFYLDFLCL